MRTLMTIVVAVSCGGLASGASRKKPARDDKRVEAMELKQKQILQEYADKLWRLAMDYTKINDYARARLVLSKAKMLVPTDEKIGALATKVDELELTQNKRVVRLDVSEGWADTRARVVKGHRFQVDVRGTWTLKIIKRLGPEGMPVKKQVRQNRQNRQRAQPIPLGAVVGRIGKSGRVFLIGAGKVMPATQSGTLYLRVNVDDPSACLGQLTCTISGTVVLEDKR